METDTAPEGDIKTRKILEEEDIPESVELLTDHFRIISYNGGRKPMNDKPEGIELGVRGGKEGTYMSEGDSVGRRHCRKETVYWKENQFSIKLARKSQKLLGGETEKVYQKGSLVRFYTLLVCIYARRYPMGRM
eukprot:1371299-Amorphochlora_amoeboformis.AAC.1